VTDNKDALRQRLEELDKKATPGPWAWGFTGDDANCAIGFAINTEEEPLTGQLDGADEDWIVREPVCANVEGSGNAELISFLRSSIPEILSALQQLKTTEAERDGLKVEFGPIRFDWEGSHDRLDNAGILVTPDHQVGVHLHKRLDELIHQRDALKASNGTKDARIAELEAGQRCESGILTWDKPMTSTQAAHYLLTNGFVAVEYARALQREVAASQARCAALENVLRMAWRFIGVDGLSPMDRTTIGCDINRALSTPSDTSDLDAIVEKAKREERGKHEELMMRRLRGLGPMLEDAGELLEKWFQTRADFPGCPTLPMSQYLKAAGGRLNSMFDRAAGLPEPKENS
jgi:hypothetical protein